MCKHRHDLFLHENVSRVKGEGWYVQQEGPNEGEGQAQATAPRHTSAAGSPLARSPGPQTRRQAPWQRQALSPPAPGHRCHVHHYQSLLTDPLHELDSQAADKLFWRRATRMIPKMTAITCYCMLACALTYIYVSVVVVFFFRLLVAISCPGFKGVRKNNCCNSCRQLFLTPSPIAAAQRC